MASFGNKGTLNSLTVDQDCVASHVGSQVGKETTTMNRRILYVTALIYDAFMKLPHLILVLSLVLLGDQYTVAFQPEPDPPTLAELSSAFSPDQSKLPVSAPDDAVMLFDGEDHQFVSMQGEEIDWPIEDGALVSTPGGSNMNHLVSQLHFRDAEIHVEFMTNAKGAGNSGIYIHGNYELQILNAKPDREPTMDSVGSLYGFSKPLVNAGRPAGQWQVYDIHYIAPRRDQDGKITEKGRITAFLNGQKVQDNTRFGEPRSSFHPYRHGTTDYLRKILPKQKQTSTGPVFLQDHNNPVRFRNVWIRPLDDNAFLYQPNKK